MSYNTFCVIVNKMEICTQDTMRREEGEGGREGEEENGWNKIGNFSRR